MTTGFVIAVAIAAFLAGGVTFFTIAMWFSQKVKNGKTKTYNDFRVN